MNIKYVCYMNSESIDLWPYKFKSCLLFLLIRIVYYLYYLKCYRVKISKMFFKANYVQ